MSIEYLKPTDQYDIEVFNRNFKAVEDAVKYGRPMDWINLPDVSQETRFTVVALLHVAPDVKNVFGFYIGFNSNEGAAPEVTVDWGDGAITTVQDYEANGALYYEHTYNFESIMAPMTSDGNKQVVLTITAPEESSNIVSISMALSGVSYNERTHYTACNLMMEIAAQAAGNAGLNLYAASQYNLRSIKLYNVKSLSATIDKSIRELVVEGPNITAISTSYITLDKLTLPSAPYTGLSFTNSIIQEITAGDLSQITANPSFTNCRALKSILLPGIRRKFTMTFAPLTREAFVALFNSLGTADSTLDASNRTLDFRSCPAYYDLTADDIKIVTDKGFIWT